MNRSLVQVGRAISRLGCWLLSLPSWQYIAGIAVLAALKTTFLWRGSFFYQEAAAFPTPVTHFSTNFIAVVLHKLSGDYVSIIFLGVSMVALAAALISLIYFQWQRTDNDEDRRIIIILAFGWPAILVVLPWIGNGTAFLPLFMILALLARHRLIWVPALLLAIATHPEHAFVGLALLALLSSRPEFSGFRRRAVVGSGLSGVAVVVTVIWLAANGVAGRGGEFTSGIGFALPFALRNGLLGAYTWWGLWWLVVAFVVMTVSRRTRWYVITLAVLGPAFLTAVTADYTRVFIGVALPVGIAMLTLLVTSGSTRSSDDYPGPRPGLALGFWFAAFLLLPNLIIMMPGDGVPLPGAYWVGLVENYVLPRL